MNKLSPFALLLTICLPFASIADEANQDKSKNEAVLSYTAEIKNDGSIPLLSSQLHQFILVPIMINNKGPYNFILDTSSDYNYISEPLAQKTNLTEVGKFEKVSKTNIGKITTTETQYRGETIKMGNVIFKNLSFFTGDNYADEDRIFIKHNIRGIIGMSTFYKYLLTIDLANFKLKLSENTLLNESKAIDITLHDFTPWLASSIITDKSYPFNLYISTYDRIMFDFKFCVDYTPNINTKERAPFYRNVGNTYNKKTMSYFITLNGNIKIGETANWQNPGILYSEEECVKTDQYGKIGSTALRKYKVSIDSKNQKILFSK